MDDEKLLQIADDQLNFLDRMSAMHQRRMLDSIQALERRIVDRASALKTSESGNLLGAKTNLAQAQKVHVDLTTLFDEEYGAASRETVKEYSESLPVIQQQYEEMGEAVKYTGVDRDMVKGLKSMDLAAYASYGLAAQDKIASAVYNHVIAQAPFSALVGEIAAALTGQKDKRGRPLANYAKQMANDGIMNFHNTVNLKKAEDAKFEHYLYVGNIIADSRPFCIARAGNVYTREQIDSWTGTWQGKSGPAFTHRGGYNCRHHWQPVRKEWIPEGGIEVQSWFDRAGVMPVSKLPKSVTEAPKFKAYQAWQESLSVGKKGVTVDSLAKDYAHELAKDLKMEVRPAKVVFGDKLDEKFFEKDRAVYWGGKSVPILTHETGHGVMGLSGLSKEYNLTKSADSFYQAYKSKVLETVKDRVSPKDFVKIQKEFVKKNIGRGWGNSLESHSKFSRDYWANVFKNPMIDTDIHIGERKLFSQYAMTDANEFWADAFTARLYGVRTGVEDLVDEAIRLAGGSPPPVGGFVQTAAKPLTATEISKIAGVPKSAASGWLSQWQRGYNLPQGWQSVVRDLEAKAGGFERAGTSEAKGFVSFLDKARVSEVEKQLAKLKSSWFSSDSEQLGVIEAAELGHTNPLSGKVGVEFFTKTLGHSEDTWEKVRSLLDAHGSTKAIQEQADVKIKEMLLGSSKESLLLKDITATETRLLRAYYEGHPKRVDAMIKSIQKDLAKNKRLGIADEYMIEDMENEIDFLQKRKYDMPKLYRGGATRPGEVESWTTNSKGAQTTHIGSSHRIAPTNARDIGEMLDEGYQSIGGIGRMMGAPGEAEVTMIRLGAVEAPVVRAAKATSQVDLPSFEKSMALKNLKEKPRLGFSGKPSQNGRYVESELIPSELGESLEEQITAEAKKIKDATTTNMMPELEVKGFTSDAMVNVGELTGWQPVVEVKKVEGIINSSMSIYEPVTVIKYQGNLVLWDGYHRVAANKLGGSWMVRAKIYDLDAYLASK